MKNKKIHELDMNNTHRTLDMEPKDDFTYVRIYKRTRDEIYDLRLTKRETHDEVIRRLIRFYLQRMTVEQQKKELGLL